MTGKLITIDKAVNIGRKIKLKKINVKTNNVY